MNLPGGLHLTHGILGYSPVESLVDDSEHHTTTMATAFGTSRKMYPQVCKPFACRSTGQFAALPAAGFATIVGQPRWTAQHLQETASSKGDAQALSEAYAEYGEAFLQHLAGAYSFAIFDQQQEVFFAGTDRMGQFPVYYRHHGDELIFGPSAGAVLAHPAVDQTLLDQGIYNYVYFHMVPGPASIFSGLNKLQASQYLKLSNGRVTVKRHWVPNFREQNTQRIPDLSIELKARLKDSVDRVFDRRKSTAAFLSGGLDSSTVAGMLAELSEGRAHAYSIGFSAEGYDEMAYARLTAKHFGIELHEYYVTPEDVVAALPSIATSYDEPFGNSSALPAWFCARVAAEDGVESLLAGDGGDEFFAGNSRYAKQAVFELYSKIPASVRKGLLQPALGILPAALPLVSKARRYIELAETRLPERLQAYNFLNQHAPEEIFQRSFLKGISTRNPVEIQNEIFSVPEAATTSLNKMLYLDWQFTLADNDLRKVSHMCSHAGVEVAYPMLDDDLVDFSCSVPSNLKLKKQDLRHFYKQALTGWLPEETIAKKKQGFGLPFGVWMKSHKPLQELAYDSLLELKKRPYFDATFIDKAISLHRSGHAAYYGELVWILTVFELWLKGHENNKR